MSMSVAAKDEARSTSLGYKGPVLLAARRLAGHAGHSRIPFRSSRFSADFRRLPQPAVSAVGPPLGFHVMDPLRHIFPLLRIDTRRPARLDTGGTWALRFPGSPHVRFGAAVAGTSWLTVAGEQHALMLEAGDGYLLTRGQAYTVGSDPKMPGED